MLLFLQQHFIGGTLSATLTGKKGLLLTNRVREACLPSFKLIPRFDPVKIRSDIDVNCSFCELHPETCSRLIRSCKFTHKRWKDVHNFITDNIFSDFYCRNVSMVFGYHDYNNQRIAFFKSWIWYYFLPRSHIHTNKPTQFFVFMKEM